MKNSLLVIIIFFLGFISSHAQPFETIWKTEQVFKTPESVYFDEARNQIYVSNINGNPTDKDGNGFISLLTRDGSVRNLKWIRGMHAPKGMLVIDSLLYVTDIDRIHIIDITHNRIVKTVDVKGAVFLNDITAGPDGKIIYITDTKTNQLLALTEGANVSLWLTDDKLISPNGLAFFRDYLFVGVNNQLLRINPLDKKIKVHVDETGPIDGLVPLGGNKYVISDWSGRIMQINPIDKVVLSNTTDANIQAADLGYIPDDGLILIPTFFDNRVVACKLP